jgi:CheY-like chemotaxis protein
VLDEIYADMNPESQPGPYLVVTVTDTGSGIPSAIKSKIFEPFFTTKEPGRGTGLGLATVFGIIKQMGGFLDVESAPGHGTTFRIALPATEELELPAVPGVDPSPRSQTNGGETLLLVDDEEDIRELAVITLESRGYRVLAAASGDEALVVAEKHAADIRVLITDVVMPGMNGVQLADIASRIIPGLKVLFVSGHSNEAISDETLRATNGDYLQKPYLGEALAAKIRAVLDRRDFLPANGRVCASGRAQNGHDTVRSQSALRHGALATMAPR